MKAEDYEVVKVIGRGAFGEVQLVRVQVCTFVCFLQLDVLYTAVLDIQFHILCCLCLPSCYKTT